jgi:hypothetical protein
MQAFVGTVILNPDVNMSIYNKIIISESNQDEHTSQTAINSSGTVVFNFSGILCIWSTCLIINSDLKTRRFNRSKQRIESCSERKNESGKYDLIIKIDVN